MKKKFFIKNKRGWLKIVEAFMAIMLVAAVLLTALNDRAGAMSEDEKEELYNEYYEEQILILKKIQLNDTLRNNVLGISDSDIPVNWSNMPEAVKTKISNEKPLYLNCSAKICSLNGECRMDEEIDEGVFVERLGIFSNSTHYNPRKLKLFCWER